MANFSMKEMKILDVRVDDIRFPTSLEAHGSDAMVNILFFLLCCEACHITRFLIKFAKL